MAQSKEYYKCMLSALHLSRQSSINEDAKQATYRRWLNNNYSSAFPRDAHDALAQTGRGDRMSYSVVANRFTEQNDKLTLLRLTLKLAESL
jgi:hypothetical protein